MIEMKKLIPIGIILCYSILIMALASCGQAFHLKKFYKKGGKLDTITKTITLVDTIPGVNGKDSIIYKDVKIDCPEPVIKTKWETRIEYKYYKDSLKDERIKYTDSLKYALRSAKIDLKLEKSNNKTDRVTVRQENKKTKWFVWLLIGVGIGLIGPFLLKKYLLPKMFQ